MTVSTSTFATTPVFQRITTSGHRATTTMTIVMSCQLARPVNYSRSLQLGIAIWQAFGLFKFNYNIENWQLAMKEDNFPEIPQEEMPQTHSMYEQLRRTSQKWFARSHKRIFQERSQYASNDCSKISHSYQLIDNQQPKQPLSQDDKARLVELMREQIEICCKQYSVKMKTVLQDQAKKIKVLGDLLVKNQMELDKKSRVIEHITASLKGFRQLKGETANKELERRTQLLQTKLTEIQQILELNHWDEKARRIEMRLKSALNQIQENYFSRLQEVRSELEDRLDRADKLSQLNLSTTKGVRNSTILSKQSDHADKKICFLQQDLQELRLQVESFQKKTYVYENFKLSETQQKLMQLSKLVAELENDRKTHRQDAFSSKVGWKGSQTTQLTHTETNNLAKSSSKSRFINRYKSMITNRKLREESCSSDNSSQSEVEATMVQEEETNVERFMRILGETRIARPVVIEIDQTGYAKSVDTGMYLVDGTGNGFEFTLSEMEYLRCRGVIEIV